MKLPQTVLIHETNFANAWARAVRYVLRDGVQMVIGGVTEPKPIRDICATISLTGAAIKQIEDHELHQQFPFQHVDPYCDEFTRLFHRKYMNLDDDVPKFPYVYIDRLANYPTRLPTHPNIDQLVVMRDSLAKEMDGGISSNRNQGITWIPHSDIGSVSPPCLQRIWIRYLWGNYVEVHIDWRSRDLFTAWQVNLIALIDMVNREIVQPNRCAIVKIIDYTDSLHIYESDVHAAEGVRLVPVSPQKHDG